MADAALWTGNLSPLLQHIYAGCADSVATWEGAWPLHCVIEVSQAQWTLLGVVVLKQKGGMRDTLRQDHTGGSSQHEAQT